MLPYVHTSICPSTYPSIRVFLTSFIRKLDELLEGTVERGAEGLDLLVEVDGGDGALGDALGGEFEFLSKAN